MHRVILFAAALSAIMIVPAAADDRDTCGDWMNGAETVAACDRLIRRNPRDADAYFKRGMYYAVGEDGGANGHDYERAIADFNQAIRLSPNNAEYWAARGDAFGYKGDFDRAIADYGQVLHLNPDDASTYAKRGDAYGDKMDYDRAIADYDQAIKLDPDESYYVGRGDLYNRKGDYARAIADYDAAIGRDDASDHTVARQHRDEALAAQAARRNTGRPAR